MAHIRKRKRAPRRTARQGGNRDAWQVQQSAGLSFGPIGTIIRHIWLAEKAAERKFHKEMGTRSGRYSALTLIEQNPGANQKMIVTALSKDKSTLSVTLRELEKEGLIERAQSKDDGRATTLWLTPAGKKKLETLREGMRRLNVELDRIVGTRREVFLDVLKDIIAIFDAPAENSDTD